ncbi:HDOD domain-containing protein [Cellvibrio sp.]|uniref:HDOD domain-containing protein n=1 Tax=Cellvibrio sp. TaxID=1965322 RepID=UPI00396489A5
MEAVRSDYVDYKSAVSALLSHPENFPRLPAITQNIREALVRSDSCASSLSKLIERDTELSQLLLRYASSVMMHNHMPPQTVFDVVRILGMAQVERITMLHAVKDLFRGNTQAYTRIFAASWDRLINKASMSALIAKKVGRVAPDYALLGSLLSEIGTLAVLSVFKSSDLPVPNSETYVNLCREFAKNLGIALLQDWKMDDEYLRLVKQVGNWQAGENEPFGLIDVVNLGLYHSLKARMTANRLPAITHLAAYQKLSAKHNAITDTNELELVVTNRDEIRAIADSLY